MGLAVGAEHLRHEGVGLVAVRPQPDLHHPQAAVGHDRPLERGVGLEADDQLPVQVDVAGLMRRDRRRGRGIDVVDALGALLREPCADLLPDGAGTVRGAREEARTALVRRVVGLDEVTHVDVFTPASAREATPRVRRTHGGFHACRGHGRHYCLRIARDAVRRGARTGSAVDVRRARVRRTGSAGARRAAVRP